MIIIIKVQAQLLLLAATKLGQGNIFTSVCLSTGGSPNFRGVSNFLGGSSKFWGVSKFFFFQIFFPKIPSGMHQSPHPPPWNAFLFHWSDIFTILNVRWLVIRNQKVTQSG